MIGFIKTIAVVSLLTVALCGVPPFVGDWIGDAVYWWRAH